MLSRLAPEYYMLSDIATNMRSGFILLNSAEQVAYSNPSAERLLGVSNRALVEEPVFDVRGQLVSLAANPESAQAELDRIWLHPEQESSIDLALADAAVRWLRVQSFPVRDNPDHLLGRGVLLDDITLERSSMQARSETLASTHTAVEPIRFSISLVGFWRVRTPNLPISVNGSGDVFAALFFHHWLQTHQTSEALSRAASSVYAIVKATLDLGSRELSLVAAQDEFTNPSQLFAAEAV